MTKTRLREDAEPGATTAPPVFQELPRPVIAFLVAGCRRQPGEALTDCLSELADEGLVRYGTGPAGLPLVSLGAERPRSGRPLLPFERVALARVRRRAGRQAQVPFSALVSDDGDDYGSWVKQQQEELGQEARRAGLAVKSAPRGMWRLTLSLEVLVDGALLAWHAVAWKAADTVAGPLFWAALFFLLVPVCLRRWRLTRAGEAAVAAWRRGGYDIPSSPSSTVPGRTVGAPDRPEAGPLPRGYGWSSFGGQWHTVRLGPLLRPAALSTPAGVGAVVALVFLASVFTVTAGAAAFQFDAAGQLVALAPAALAGTAFLALWLPAFIRRRTLPDEARYLGEIIRLQYSNGGDDSPDHHYAWIDDGSAAATKWDLSPGLYQRLSVGDLVEVTWSPRRRRVTDISPAAR